MLSQLLSNPGNSCSGQLLLLILLVLQLGTNEAATATSSALDGAEQQLSVDSGQPSTSWLNINRHWPLGDGSDDDTCQPPMLWAPVSSSSKSGSAVRKGQASQTGGSEASGSSGQNKAAGQKLAEREQVEAEAEQDEGQQLENDFTCKDHENEVVSWFIVIKEKGSYNYVFATSINQAFSGLQRNIHQSGPLHNTLQQTRQYQTAHLLYSYTSHGAASNEGHQNGVLLFGKQQGFWLIHSWRQYFYYFWHRDFQDKYKIKTKGQAFICTTHSTASDLENIGKQLFISKPHPSGHYIRPGLENPYWIAIINRSNVTSEQVEQLCGSQRSSKQHFTIGNQINLIHYSKSGFNKTDIYDSIAIDNGIDGSSSCLKVQSWQPLVNQGVVQDVPDHVYPGLEPTVKRTTDHSKWCVPVNIGAGRPPNAIKFVCIGDLNMGQTNRPGGAMCLWNDTVWEYFKKISIAYKSAIEEA